MPCLDCADRLKSRAEARVAQPWSDPWRFAAATFQLWWRFKRCVGLQSCGCGTFSDSQTCYAQLLQWPYLQPLFMEARRISKRLSSHMLCWRASVFALLSYRTKRLLAAPHVFCCATRWLDAMPTSSRQAHSQLCDFRYSTFHFVIFAVFFAANGECLLFSCFNAIRPLSWVCSEKSHSPPPKTATWVLCLTFCLHWWTSSPLLQIWQYCQVRELLKDCPISSAAVMKVRFFVCEFVFSYFITRSESQCFAIDWLDEACWRQLLGFKFTINLYYFLFAFLLCKFTLNPSKHLKSIATQSCENKW